MTELIDNKQAWQNNSGLQILGWRCKINLWNTKIRKLRKILKGLTHLLKIFDMWTILTPWVLYKCQKIHPTFETPLKMLLKFKSSCYEGRPKCHWLQKWGRPKCHWLQIEGRHFCHWFHIEGRHFCHRLHIEERWRFPRPSMWSQWQKWHPSIWSQWHLGCPNFWSQWHLWHLS